MAWNRPSEDFNDKIRKQDNHSRNRSKSALVLVLSLIVIGVAAILWSLLRGENKESTAQENRTPKSSVIHAPTNIIEKRTLSEKLREHQKSLNTATNIGEKAVQKKIGAFAPGMLRLPNGSELRFILPKKGETRKLIAGGETWEIDSEGNVTNISPPPIFDNAFEDLISTLYERDGLVIPIAFKRYSEADVRRMCKEPTYAYDDDTPEITAKRQNVAMLKTAILDYLDRGGKFADFVDEMCNLSQEEQRNHLEGRRNVYQLLGEGKDVEAAQYYAEHSEKMESKGFNKVKLDKRTESYLQQLNQQKLDK